MSVTSCDPSLEPVVDPGEAAPPPALQEVRPASGLCEGFWGLGRTVPLTERRAGGSDRLGMASGEDRPALVGRGNRAARLVGCLAGSVVSLVGIPVAPHPVRRHGEDRDAKMDVGNS